MKKNFLSKGIGALALSLSAFTYASCLSDGDDTIILESGNSLGIPSDANAGENPVVEEPTTTLPNAQCTVTSEDGYAVMHVDMTGVWDADNGDWLTLYGTGMKGQNIWLSVDGEPKGIDVYNNSQDQGRTIMADLVFLVDNSGSMSEEADAIAAGMKDWSAKLAASGLDVRFGSVGYGDSYHAVDGALNLTTTEALQTYLNRSSGISRTYGYGGEDAQRLQSVAEGGKYENGTYNECGMVALHYAHDNFKFRNGANRIYVNFTDEPNQPYNIKKWSVEYLNPNVNPNNWNPANGTIHTVYSENPTAYTWKYLQSEKPWLMSEYTGGSIIYTDRDFTGVTLDDLPVTGAMQNSYIIRFTNIEKYMDGQPHMVKITVVSADGKVRAEKVFSVIFA